MRLRVPFFLVVLSVFASCVSTSPRITAAGFAHERYPYSVPIAPTERVLPEGWVLDNYYVTSTGEVKPKWGEGYTAYYAIDANGDGRMDLNTEEPAYDLRYVHERHAGVIWLRTTPTSPRFGQMELPVLGQAYADEIAGAGYEIVLLQGAAVAVESRRYAAKIVSQVPMQVAGMPAHAVTLDVANVDQLQLTPGGVYRRVRVVLIRPGFTYVRSRAGRELAFPVLMVAGYANQPERFAEGEADFEQLLARITINGQRGVLSDAQPPATQPATDDEQPAPETSEDDSDPPAPMPPDLPDSTDGDAEDPTPETPAGVDATPSPPQEDASPAE